MTGGVTALAGTLLLGPRIGKLRRDGVGLMPGPDLPTAVMGTLILAFGWFGLDSGSRLARSDSRVALIAVNTMLAGSAGAVTTLFA